MFCSAACRPALAVAAATGILLLAAACTPQKLQEADTLQSVDISQVRSLVDNLTGMTPNQVKERVVVIEQLVNRMLDSGKPQLVPPFLSLYLERMPSDPYQAYYAYLIGKSYEARRQAPLAALWYHRCLGSSADVIAQGESVHLQALRHLLELDPDSRDRIELYSQLLERFPDQIDPGRTWYHLARAYEDAGLYPKAFQAYGKFLEYPATVIPGKLDEQQRVREILALSTVNRDWTRQDLNQLLQEIRTALATKDLEKILSLQAKVNFFSMSWLQEKADFNSQVSYDLRRFVQGSPHIYCENNLEGNSNSQEAYLKTWGWNPYMPIWYLYFRRINYPADPEINGNWEWAGIYFGSSLQ
jgi:hypothetical protein